MRKTMALVWSASLHRGRSFHLAVPSRTSTLEAVGPESDSNIWIGDNQEHIVSQSSNSTWSSTSDTDSICARKALSFRVERAAAVTWCRVFVTCVTLMNESAVSGLVISACTKAVVHPLSTSQIPSARNAAISICSPPNMMRYSSSPCVAGHDSWICLARAYRGWSAVRTTIWPGWRTVWPSGLHPSHVWPSQLCAHFHRTVVTGHSE